MTVEQFTGRFECVSRDADDVTLFEVIPIDDANPWQHRRWVPGLPFRQSQFDAVDFVPQIGMRFDLTFEFHTADTGSIRAGQIVITSVRNVTGRGA